MVKKIKIGDYIIFSIFIVFFACFSFYVFNIKEEVPEKVEIYINSELKYVQKLQNEEKNGDSAFGSIYVGRTFRSECYGSGRRHNYSWFLTGRCRI